MFNNIIPYTYIVLLSTDFIPFIELRQHYSIFICPFYISPGGNSEKHPTLIGPAGNSENQPHLCPAGHTELNPLFPPLKEVLRETANILAPQGSTRNTIPNSDSRRAHWTPGAADPI
jgi:hypothetical protein